MARPSNTEEKRKELLAKATACFKKFGYDRTTLDDVAKAMNLNKASLYYYVKNKEELFMDVLLQEATKRMTQLITEAEKIQEPVEQLVHFFKARVDVYIGLIKLNSISRENILLLQNQFLKVYESTNEKEFEFVCKVLASVPELSYRDEKLKEFAQLLFEIVNAIKHDAVLLGTIMDNDDKASASLKLRIEKTVNIFIHSTYII